MPHLGTSALESDPRGMALLREVIGTPTRTGSWIAAQRAHTSSPRTERGCQFQQVLGKRLPKLGRVVAPE
jgi:hypothetical protein